MNIPHDKIISLSPTTVPMWVVFHNKEIPARIEVHPVFTLALIEEYEFNGDYDDDGPIFRAYQKIEPVFLCDMGYIDKSLLAISDPGLGDEYVEIYTYLYEPMTTEEANQKYGDEINSMLTRRAEYKAERKARKETTAKTKLNKPLIKPLVMYGD